MVRTLSCTLELVVCITHKSRKHITCMFVFILNFYFSDINECDFNDTCDQECTNSYSSFTCSCSSGFELVNETMCIGKYGSFVCIYTLFVTCIYVAGRQIHLVHT